MNYSKLLRASMVVAVAALLAVAPVSAAGRPSTDVDTSFQGEATISYWCIPPNPYTGYGWYADRVDLSVETASVTGFGSVRFDGWSTIFVAPGEDDGQLTMSGRGGTITWAHRTAFIFNEPQVTIDPTHSSFETTGSFTKVSGTLGTQLQWVSQVDLRFGWVNCFDSSDAGQLLYGTFVGTPPVGGPFQISGTAHIHLDYLGRPV